MEQIDPWDCIKNDAFERYKSRFHNLVNDYEQNGDFSEVARIKADNTLLTVYRKELRKVFLEYLQWMHAVEKDSTFQKVMHTQKELKDIKGFVWQESAVLAINKWKFLLNRLFVKQKVSKDEN